MSVAAISQRGMASSGSEFTCPHYAPLPGTRRCRSYQDGGTCARADLFLCIEWEKRNRHRLPSTGDHADEVVAAGVTVATSEPPAPRTPTDLFGNPAPELALPKAKPTRAIPCPTSSPHVGSDQETRPPPRGLTTEDIESFKALNVEVCLRSEALGEVWLVPAYTGRDRREITPEHAATICRVLEAFPGSRVVSIEKSSPTEKEADA